MHKRYLKEKIIYLKQRIVMSEYRKLREYMNAHNINEETTTCREIV